MCLSSTFTTLFGTLKVIIPYNDGNEYNLHEC